MSLATRDVPGVRTEDRTWFDVRRQWWVVLGCLMAGLISSWYYTQQATPQYQSSAQILLYGKVIPIPLSSASPSSSAGDALVAASRGAALNQAATLSKTKIQTYAQLGTSSQVLLPVMTAAGISGDVESLRSRVQILADGNSGTLTVMVQDQDATRASRAAAGIAERLPQVVATLETQADKKPPIGSLVLREATQPLLPYWPRLDLNLAVGLVAGLVVGIGLATIRDQLDTRVRRAQSLFESTLSWPLATVPTIGRRRMVRRAEELSRLVVNLGYGSGAHGPQILLLTSPRPDRHRAELARDLAATVSRDDRRVLVVDCDLRSALLTSVVGNRDSPGLSDALAGLVDGRALVRSTDRGQNFLGAGRRPPNPVQLLASRSMAELLTSWAEEYDVVILDGAQALGIADVLALVPQCTAVLCVVRDAMSRRHQVAEMLSTVRTARGNVAGTVLISDKPSRAVGMVDVTRASGRQGARV